MTNRKNTVKYAFSQSLPVMAGYIVLGVGVVLYMVLIQLVFVWLFCYRFLERKRRKELYILFRDISEDISTKKRIVLDTTYFKNDSKQINIRKYSRQPVSLQIVCCYVFCILSNLPRATIKLSHCASQNVICLRRLAASVLPFSRKR